jgi:hypothetical protein
MRTLAGGIPVWCKGNMDNRQLSDAGSSPAAGATVLKATVEAASLLDN